MDPYTHRYKEGPFTYTWQRNGELIQEPGHATDLITNEAIQWISKQTQPWFCYLPYTAVHTPIRAPEEWIDRYWGNRYDPDPVRDRSFKTYAAYTSHMDYNIGRLIETLKCLDLLDNTIIVFASDNGAVTYNPREDTAQYPGRHEDMPRTGSNYPLRGHKGQLYDGGIRTPAIISWPAKLRPRKFDQPIHIADWMPTFAALLGFTPSFDPQWDGVNILPVLLEQEEQVPERIFYWNLLHQNFAVRCGDWKLIFNSSNPLSSELFNMKEDPLEERNRAARHPDIVSRLTEVIENQHKMDNVAVRKDVK